MSTQYKEFPSIIRQAKWIVYLYKMIGLYSVPLLTAVTVVSMSNVFVSGEFAQQGWIKNTWAFVFALSIDVNIVRLFVESKVDKSAWAFTIGLGLGIVTGAALLIEGLQQAIGIQWNNGYVQIVIAIITGLRVVFVIILMAREGRKLGDLVLMVVSTPVPKKVLAEETTQEHDTGPIVNPLAIEDMSSEQGFTNQQETPTEDTNDTPGELPIVSIEKHKKPPVSKQSNNASERVYNVLKTSPSATLTELQNKAKVSRGYASRIRSQWMSEQQQSA